MCKGDTSVVFNEQGKVISCTLGEDAAIMLDGKTMPYVIFKSLTPILFNADGSVAKGIIKTDTYLRPAGWENRSKEDAGFILYKVGTEITFNNKGEVVGTKTN